MRLAILLPALILAPVAAADGELSIELVPLESTVNLLPNAAFEKVTDGLPSGWSWDARNTDATLTVVEGGPDGGRCLRLTNGTAYSAHVYGVLRAPDIPVQPETAYTLSYYCRTTAPPGIAWVGGGRDWRVRLRLPHTAGAWQRVTTTFRTGAEDRSIPLLVVTESPTAPFYLDDVQLEPGAVASPFDAPDTLLPPQVLLSPGSEGAGAGARWKPERYPPETVAFAAGELLLEGGMRLPEAVPGGTLEVALTFAGEPPRTTRCQAAGGLPRRGRLTARASLPANAPDSVTLEARLLDAAERPRAIFQRELQVITAAGIEAGLAPLAESSAALRQRAANDDYQRVTATVVANFSQFIREDLAQGQLARAHDALRVLRELVARAAAEPASPAAPRYQTGPLRLAGPTFVGSVRDLNGQISQRPVQFVGYGHFGAVRRDVEKFPDYGCNLIQIEFGPNSVLTGEDQISTKEIDAFLAVCDRAARANVAVNLLLSPHYFPAWALAKWPHLKEFSGGFLKYCIYAPEARQVIERSLRTVISRIKDHPALHSVCLTNEPIAVDLSRCEAARALWQQWLTRRFGTVEAINARWGTQHPSIESIPVPPPKLEASALNYDFTIFNQESFAAWHRWMADLVHGIAPGLPVHAKIMMAAHFQRSLSGDWSVAPELFGELSDINGNDCVKWPDRGDWANAWVTENMGYDYQRSAADKPVFNSENHLILDRDVGEVSPAHIRNVLWQGAVHGQSATTIWVWERTNSPESDLAGSILHRPECVEAAGRTALDLNAAAPELAALAAVEAPVAVFWSQASSVWNPREHNAAARRVYTAANFLDVPVGFVNERDCQAYAAGRPNRTLDAARLVLVPAASHVPEAVVRALQRFLNGGGRVVTMGRCFSHDETGRERSLAPLGEAWPCPTDPASERATWERLRPLAAIVARPLVAVGRYGVEARAARVGQRLILNLCNYRPESETVALPDGFHDAFTGAAVGAALELTPLLPRLLIHETAAP